MYQIFNGLDHRMRGERRDTNLDRLVDQQKSTLQTAQQYYQQNYFDVKLASNPFVRLCYSFAWGNLSPFDYYQRAIDEEDYLTTAVGVVTTQTPGTVYRDCFYGEDTLTLLVGERQKNNLQKAINGKAWRELKPLRLLKMPFLTSAFIRPDLAKGLPFNENYCLATVDIPALAMMFRGWDIENQKRPPDQRHQMEHFLGRWVYPQLLWDQMDCIVRRGLVLGPESDEWDDIRKPSFLSGTLDYSKELLDHAYNLLYNNSKSQLNWFGLLHEVPSFINGTMDQAMPYIEAPFAVNNQWTSVAALIETGLLCENFGSNTPDKGKLINVFDRYDRHLRSNRWLSRIPDDDVREMITPLYDEFKEGIPTL